MSFTARRAIRATVYVILMCGLWWNIDGACFDDAVKRISRRRRDLMMISDSIDVAIDEEKVHRIQIYFSDERSEEWELSSTPYQTK